MARILIFGTHRFIEINVGIICACLPQLKPFFRQYLPFIVSGGRSHGTSRKMRSQSHPLSSFNNEGHTASASRNKSNVLGSRRSAEYNTSTEEIYGQGEDFPYKSSYPPTEHEGQIVRTTEVDIQYGSSNRR